MKETPFTRYHIARGAKMAPFAGYNMPIEFTGINDEHLAVRTRAGLFDVSHMGEIWVKGPNAFSFLQRVTTNDIGRLTDGKVQYSCFPNGKGGIVDDLLVYRVDSLTYLLVVNAANIEKDWEFLRSYAGEYGMTPGAELCNASDEIAQLALQGPLAGKIMQRMCDEQVLDMETYTFRKMNVAGIPETIVSATGYTGAGGYEIYVDHAHASRLWEAIRHAGEPLGMQPIGLGARDTLRLEMGFCLYGNDIDDTTSPIEAGLGWITKFADGKDFIDRKLFEKQKAEGVGRKLVGFRMIDRGIPRYGYELTGPDGTVIGQVTSGTMSPCLKVGIGLGYIRTEFARPGTAINVMIRERELKAEVVRPPFYKSE